MKQFYIGNINRLYLLKQNGQYILQTKEKEKNVHLYRNFFGCWVRNDNGEVPTKEEEALDLAYNSAKRNPNIPEGTLIGGYSYLDEDSIKPSKLTKEEAKLLRRKFKETKNQRKNN